MSNPLQNTNNIPNTEGWNYKCETPSGPLPVGQIYFGLNCFYGSKTVEGGYIMIYDLPPHYQVRVAFKYKSWLILKSINYEQESYLFADGKVIFYETNNFFFFYSGAFSGEFSHTSETLLLEFLQLGDIPAMSTSGFRELTIDLVLCPSGCQSCNSNILASCIIWSVIDYKMKAKDLYNFNNDGWKPLGEKPANIYKCGRETQFYFFGFFDKTTKLEKTVFLQPHYAIQIQFLIIYINFNRQTKPTTTILFNDLTVYEIVELLDVLQLMICNYIPSEQMSSPTGDQVTRVNFQRAHNQPILKITIAQQQASDINTPWGIRDFRILLKKCHSSCLYSCSGPLISDCFSANSILMQFVSFFTDSQLISFDGWNQISVYTDNKICNGQQIIGGVQDISIQKLSYTIFNLPQHSQIFIQFLFYQIDSFQNNEKLYVDVDDVIVYEQQLVYINDLSIGSKLCGNTQQLDTSFQVKVNSIDHASNNAIIKFYVLGTTTVGRWGIRELQIKADMKLVAQSMVKDDKTVISWHRFTDTLQILNCQNLNFKLIYIQKNTILRKKLKDIPNHTRIFIKFEVVVVYQFKFNNSKYLYLQIDGQNVWKQNFLLTSEINICDNSNRSQKFIFEALIDHQSSNCVLDFIADGSGPTESIIYFGIRNVIIQYEKILVS
ncbi:unnamed protein product [Paramecium primaurelia]|uniref:Uncharacterized protein n=1 Tax=Paramecium primaurelia TaxID=5886 RepID=A0A8S1PZT8_PARPR|nr:unnamed protein product [Paramecium primaurelia]